MRTAILLLSAALLLAGCSGSSGSDDDPSGDGNVTAPPPPPPGAAGSQTHMVELANNAFMPNAINITAGDTVRWTHNDGTTPHNVESSDPQFDSHPNCTVGVPVSQVCMVDGDTYQWTFEEAQDVTVRCEIHPGMTGTIHVLPAGNATA